MCSELLVGTFSASEATPNCALCSELLLEAFKSREFRTALAICRGVAGAPPSPMQEIFVAGARATGDDERSLYAVVEVEPVVGLEVGGEEGAGFVS